MGGPNAKRVMVSAPDADQSVAVDATSPSRCPCCGWPWCCSSPASGCIAGPAAAQADDLIQLNGDPPVTLAGGVGYGLLYLDGAVRLAGDTAITATDVFIGPDAQLRPASTRQAGNNCANGRSLTITASGGVAISPAIDLRGRRRRQSLGRHARDPRRRASRSAAASRRPARTRRPAASRSTRPGSSSRRPCTRPGAGISCTAAAASRSAATSRAPAATPRRAQTRPRTSGGGVDLASSGGDVNVLGSIASWGRDVAGAGARRGRQRRRRDRRGRRRPHLGRHRLARRAAAWTSRPGSPAPSRSRRAAPRRLGAVDASGDSRPAATAPTARPSA